jgi:hypothetical protein
MASRSTNTMAELLQRLLSDLAQAKVLQDADLPFIMELETAIVSKLRDPMMKMQEAGMLPPGPAAPQQQMFPGQGMPVGGGVMQGAGTPPVDELRRLMM